jgi:hypothetical protein
MEASSRSLKPLLMPEIAAPLGRRLHLFDLTFVASFTGAELAARYRNRGGYVSAFSRAADELVADGLYDPQLAARYVSEVARGPVLKH